MNFSLADFKIIVAMTGAIILITAIFSAAGVADESVRASDYPELEIEQDRFGFALDYPDNPKGDTEGTLIYTSESPNDVCSYSGSPASHQAWIYRERGSDGNTVEGTQVTWLPTVESCDGSFENATMEATVGEFTQGGNWLDAYSLSPGESVTHQNGTTEIYLEYTNREVTNDSFRAELRFEVISHEHVGNEAFANNLVDAVVRGVLLLGWFMTFAFELIANFLFVMFSVTTYLFNLLYFVLDTYVAVATSVSGVWQAITLLPSIVLSLEIGKLVFVAISIIR